MTNEVLPNIGFEALGNLIGTTWGWMAFGTGTADATNLDGALQNEVLRKPSTYTLIPGDNYQIEWVCRIEPGDIDATITEVMIINEATTGGQPLVIQTRAPLVCDSLHGGEFHVPYALARSG